jgi:hypothetical protein
MDRKRRFRVVTISAIVAFMLLTYLGYAKVRSMQIEAAEVGIVSDLQKLGKSIWQFVYSHGRLPNDFAELGINPVYYMDRGLSDKPLCWRRSGEANVPADWVVWEPVAHSTGIWPFGHMRIIACVGNGNDWRIARFRVDKIGQLVEERSWPP